MKKSHARQNSSIPPQSDLALPNPLGLIHIYQPHVNETIGHWVLAGQLDTAGAEAEIWLARHTDDPQRQVIIKFYRYGHASSLPEALLRSLDNPRIIQTLAAGTMQARAYEIIEYCPARGLDRLLEKKTKLNEAECLTLLQQMTEGVAYLHKNRLQHRDLKPANILIRSSDPLAIAISDFGGSHTGGMTTRLTQTIGTLLYTAPELATGYSSTACDWWSVGMILLEVMTGHHPFAGLDPRHLHFRIASGQVKLPDYLAPAWVELFNGLLNSNPQSRWREDQVMAWVQQTQAPSCAGSLVAAANRRNQKTDIGTNLPRDSGAILVGLLLMATMFETVICLKDAHLKAAGTHSPSQEVAPATHTLTQVAPAVKSPAPILPTQNPSVQASPANGQTQAKKATISTSAQGILGLGAVIAISVTMFGLYQLISGNHPHGTMILFGGIVLQIYVFFL